MLKTKKKYAVVGQATYNVYYISSSRPNCLWFLQKKYPKKDKNKILDLLSENAKERSRFFCSLGECLLPEAMRIIECPIDWTDQRIKDYFNHSLKESDYLIKEIM